MKPYALAPCYNALLSLRVPEGTCFFRKTFPVSKKVVDNGLFALVFNAYAFTFKKLPLFHRRPSKMIMMMISMMIVMMMMMMMMMDRDNSTP